MQKRIKDTIPNCHKDEAIYIIGGGASLKGFDFNRLNGKVTIACNKAILHHEATYMVYMDDQFYDWHEDDIKSFRGLKFTHDWNKPRDGVITVLNGGALGLSEDIDDGIVHGGNAGYFALNLAYLMGANPIYLLGVDMCYSKGDTHFHNGYPNEDTVGEKRFAHMINAFKYGATILEERGVKVFNCSAISALTCFDKYDLGEV